MYYDWILVYLIQGNYLNYEHENMYIASEALGTQYVLNNAVIELLNNVAVEDADRSVGHHWEGVFSI